MKRKVKRYDGGGNVVRTRTDDEIAEDSKFGGYGRYMPKTKEYSLDEVKGKLSGLFGGSSGDSSKFSELESVGGAGRRARSIEEQIGRKAAPKEETKAEPEEKAPSGFSKHNKTGKASTVSDEDAPYKVEKVEKAPAPSPKKKRKLPSNPDAPNYDTGDEGPAKVGNQNTFNFDLRPKKKEGKGLTPYAKGNSFAGSTEGWAKMLKDSKKKEGYKSGGSVSSASSRGDGIAQRGKTRGRMV